MFLKVFLKFLFLTGTQIRKKKICESLYNSKAVKSLHVIQFYLLKTSFEFEWKPERLTRVNYELEINEQTQGGLLTHSSQSKSLLLWGNSLIPKHPFRASVVIQGAISISYSFSLLWYLEYICQRVNLTWRKDLSIIHIFSTSSPKNSISQTVFQEILVSQHGSYSHGIKKGLGPNERGSPE